MQIYKLQLSNKVIDVFIERKKIRNYYIKINPDLTVTVPIPLSIDINFPQLLIKRIVFCILFQVINNKNKQKNFQRKTKKIIEESVLIQEGDLRTK